MYGERLENERPFREYSLSEIDLSLMSYHEAVDWLGSLANDSGFDPNEVLYCGIEAYSISLNGTFGERNETWACTQDELLTSADKASRYGNWGTDSPFYYALLTAKPGVVLFDKSKFDNLGNAHRALEEKEIRNEKEYRLKPGITMDEAVVAVAYFTA